jgi:hypothetical protein
MVNRVLLLFALATLVPTVFACGGATTDGSTPSRVYTSSTGSTSTQGPGSDGTQNYTKADGDKDGDFGSGDDKNNRGVLEFGRPASAANHRQIVSLLKRYYAAVAVGDGASACSMTYSTLAESLPEDYGMAPGPLYLRGAKSCPEVLTLMFAHFHGRLAAEGTRFKAAKVLLDGGQGIAIVNFGSMPERQITIEREGPRIWKVATVLDRELP